MEPGGIRITRELPIDATRCSAVLLRLRRDNANRVARWSLGPHGTFELDVHFALDAGRPGVSEPGWATTARLWDVDQLAPAPTEARFAPVAEDRCSLMLAAVEPIAPWWASRLPALRELAVAAVDELGEELLWHASRVDAARYEA